MLLWLSTALAGSTIAGHPFEPETVLGFPDDRAPGVGAVLLTEAKVTCKNIGELGSATFKKAVRDAPAVMAVFSPMTVGGGSMSLMAFRGEAAAIGTNGATIEALNGTAGGAGTIVLDAKLKTMEKGLPVKLKGTHPFQMCGALLARPSLTDTAFETKKMKRDHLEAPIEAPIPVGWTPDQGPFKDSWLGPDGISLFDLRPSLSIDELPASAKSQVESFQGNGNQGELLTSEAVDDRTYTVRWRHRYADGPWTTYQTVHRFTEDGSWGVTCSIQGDEQTAEEAFPVFEKACLTIDPA